MTDPTFKPPDPRVPLLLRIERARHRALFLVLRTLIRRVRFDQLRRFGAWLGELQFRAGVLSRHRMVHELAVLLGRPASDPAVYAAMREAYRNNNAAVLEILKMFDRRQDEAMLLSKVEVDGIATLHAALAEGRGAILLAGHMGNGALLVVRLIAAGLPVSVVYREARMMDTGLFERGLPFYAIEGIRATDGIKAYAKMLSALRRNRVVYMMADQGTKKAKDGMVVRFLGKDMPMPAGPAQLARHANAPVLPVAAIAAQPIWKFEILPPLPRDEAASLEQDVEALLRVSERLILRRPALWSWHHRRWRHFPLAVDAGRPRNGGPAPDQLGTGLPQH